MLLVAKVEEAQKLESTSVTTAKNLSSTIFALVAGVVGLIVDVVGLVGIITGFVPLPAGSLFRESPIALGLVTFFSMVYSLLLFLVFLRVYLRKRWITQGNIVTSEAEVELFSIISYLVWIPLFWLWSIVVWKAGVQADYVGGVAAIFVMFWCIAIAGGGAFLRDTAQLLDTAFNPELTGRIHEARYGSGRKRNTMRP